MSLQLTPTGAARANIDEPEHRTGGPGVASGVSWSENRDTHCAQLQSSDKFSGDLPPLRLQLVAGFGRLDAIGYLDLLKDGVFSKEL